MHHSQNVAFGDYARPAGGPPPPLAPLTTSPPTVRFAHPLPQHPHSLLRSLKPHPSSLRLPTNAPNTNSL